MKLYKSQRGTADMLLTGLLAVALIAAALAYYFYAKNNLPVTNPAPMNKPPAKTTASTDPYAGWKIYTSVTEKASFKYPSNWTTGSTKVQPNSSGADSVAIKSPSGAVTVTWLSEIDGLGGACDGTIPVGQSGACPDITVVNTSSIAGASGLSLEEGILTNDGKSYEPFLCVLDSDKLLSGRGTAYDEFTGRNNGKTLGISNNTTALFTTAGVGASGPDLSQSDAQAYFNKPEVLQAKLILESLTY